MGRRRPSRIDLVATIDGQPRHTGRPKDHHTRINREGHAGTTRGTQVLTHIDATAERVDEAIDFRQATALGEA